MGEEIAFEKWQNFQFSKARDLDLGSGHTAYHHASHGGGVWGVPLHSQLGCLRERRELPQRGLGHSPGR